MVVMRRLETGSRLGSGAASQDRPALSKDRVSEIIREEVIEFVWGQLPEMRGYIKTAMAEYFNERYATIVETAAEAASTTVMSAGGRACRDFQYRDFDSAKPLPSVGFTTQL